MNQFLLGVVSGILLATITAIAKIGVERPDYLLGFLRHLLDALLTCAVAGIIFGLGSYLADRGRYCGRVPYCLSTVSALWVAGISALILVSPFAIVALVRASKSAAAYEADKSAKESAKKAAKFERYRAKRPARRRLR